MDIKTEKDGQRATVRIAGEMTIYHAFNLKKAVIDSLAECDELLLDLSEVSEIDTAGVQILILARREAAGLNKSFRVERMSAAAEELISLYRLKNLLN